MAAKCEVLATCRKTGEIGTRATLACRIDDQFGLWLSLVERLVRDQEAVGSNPTSPIIFVRNIFSRFLVLVLLIATGFSKPLLSRKTDAS